MSSILLILDNIRSTHNVGSIMRTADGFGISTIYCCGYTPYPELPNDSRLPHERAKISRAIHKTALGAEQNIEIIQCATTAEAITRVRSQGYSVASLEQSPNSIPLQSYIPSAKLAIVLGNEVTGVASDTLDISDITLEIPMYGKKESFNVSISTAICLYELTRGKTSAA